MDGHVLRQAMMVGGINTVAGDGTVGYSGDGGPAINAELAGLYGVAVDGAGNLVIAVSDPCLPEDPGML